MVCVPCFVIPVLLYIWHRFLQPIVFRYWNPWAKKDAQGNVIKAEPQFPFECKGGSCPFVPGGRNNAAVEGDVAVVSAGEGVVPAGEGDVTSTPRLTPASSSLSTNSTESSASMRSNSSTISTNSSTMGANSNTGSINLTHGGVDGKKQD